MRTLARSVVTVVAVVCTLGLLAGPAFATTYIGIAPAGEITATSNGQVSFNSPLGAIRCEATLTGVIQDGVIPLEHFGTSLPEDWVGEVTGYTLARCTEPFGRTITGRALGLPWSIDTTAFLGTLPRITGIRATLLGASVSFEGITGISGACLYGGEIPLLMTFPAGERGNSVSLASNRLSRRSGGALCPESGEVSGTFTSTTESLETFEPNGNAFIDCTESAFGGGGLEFETINPGGQSRRILTCVPGIPNSQIDVRAGTRIRNPRNFTYDAARVITGKTIDATHPLEITITFAPPANAPRLRSFLTSFELETQAGTKFIAGQGITTP
jgi:hypothetical protein